MTRTVTFLVFFVLALAAGTNAQVIDFWNAQDQEAAPTKGVLPWQRTAAASISLQKTMSYQGLLTTSAGAPVPDGTYDLAFDLYDSSSGGILQWTETHSGVAVHRGTFDVILGTTDTLNVDFNRTLHLEVRALSGPAGPSYPLVFSPRSQLTSAPSSLAPWTPSGGDIHFNDGRVGIGTATPGSDGIGTLRMELADSDGLNSDIAMRVAGGGAGGGYGIFNFAKSRGSLAVPATVNNADYLGGTAYQAFDGNAFVTAAGIYGTVDSIPAVGKVAGRLSFWTTSSGGTFHRGMSLDRNGSLTVLSSLGIGTTSPLSQLHVRGASPVRILGDLATLSGGEYVDFMARNTPFGSDIGGMRIRRDSLTGDVNASIYAAASGNSASEKMRVNGNGNVGIGTATPLDRLHVYSSSFQTVVDIQNASANGRIWQLYSTGIGNSEGAGHFMVRDGTAGAVRMFVSGSSGFVGLGTSTPSERLEVQGSERVSDTIFASNLSGGGPLRLQTSGTTRMVVDDATGNVGIGTATPLSQLHVKGASPVRILGDLTTLSAGEYVDFMARNTPFGTDIGGVRIRRDSLSGDVNTAFFAAAAGFPASEKMRVRGNGNVGIGTTNPTVRLQVGENGDGTVAKANAWTTFSDRRLKKDIRPITDALAKAGRLSGVSFRWAASGEPSIGFIAQDVAQVLPEIVTADKDGYLSLDYGKMTPLLLEALKEQQKEIEELKGLVRSLVSERAKGGDRSIGEAK